MGDRELLAMKAAFEEWRHWLEGSTHPFLVLTDHKNLEYLRTAKRLNPRQARWSLFFSRFQFTITFRPGSKNTKADSLSRQFDSETSIKNPETILSPDLVIGPIQWDIETELELANAHTGIHPECPPGKLYVPETLSEKVLKHVHALPSSGHPGITATIHLLQNRFWWSTLSQDVNRFVQQCKTCNMHVSLLKPATPPTEEERGDCSRPSSQSNAVQTSQAIVVEGEEAYRVHQLLDSRRRGGHHQYLVDWEGCSPEEQSWVNSRDILDPMLTQEFHCNHPEKPAPRARGRPRRRQHPRAGSRSQGGGLCYGFQFPGFLHLSITSALSRVLAQCILPSSMLHLRCDCLSPVLYQRSLPSLYLLHLPCRLCEVLPLYVCMSERFSFYSVYLLSLTHAELTLSICLQPALRPPARSGF